MEQHFVDIHAFSLHTIQDALKLVEPVINQYTGTSISVEKFF